MKPGSDQDHEAVWRSIDAIADKFGLSTAGLARRAGLDPTAFNASKRLSPHRRRWPSTEAISSVLSVVGMSWAEWGALVDAMARRK